MSKTWHDKVFFGLHFDIHAGLTDVGLGSDLTTDHLIEEFSKMKPDWVQCDCKGHPGYASYPSKLGNAAPGIVKDALRMWRDATKKLEIPLVMHYSGVWDSAAIVAHPEWARVNAPQRVAGTDGKTTIIPGQRDVNGTCNLSEYTEKLMIPQLIELVQDYDVDGFWVDGENWGSAPCYCDICLAEFEKRTGMKEAPLSAEEPNWNEWLQFQRDNFESHVEKYRAAVKKADPDVTVCSNWMYTTRQPDDMKVPVDYISGDFDFIWSTTRAMTEARSMDSRNISWDLMAWGFGSSGNPHHWQFKTVEALCSEASVVMSCGGAVSFYDTPNRTGRIISWHMDDLAEVARFCRARQPYCAGTRSVKQIAIMNAPSSMYGTSKPLFNLGSSSTTVDGALHALLDCGYHADILTENDMVRHASEYPLCVIPEQEMISETTTDALLKYVENGGNLIVSGAELTKRFDRVMGAEDTGKTSGWKEFSEVDIPYGAGTTTLIGDYRFVRNNTAFEIKPLLLSRDRGESERRSGSPAASAVRYGKGRIACIYGPAFNSYGSSHYFGMAELTGDIVRAMDISHLYRADVPSGLHITIREKGSGLFVNFINLRTLKPLSNRSAMIDGVPSAGPVHFEIELESKPTGVYMAPTANPVDWTYFDGVLKASVPLVGIHEILVIERKPSDV